MCPVGPDAVVEGVSEDELLGEFEFLLKVTDLVEKPDAVAPGVIIFGFDF